MLDYDSSDIINKNFLNFIAPPYKEIVYNAIQNDFQDPYEIELIKKTVPILMLKSVVE